MTPLPPRARAVRAGLALALAVVAGVLLGRERVVAGVIAAVVFVVWAALVLAGVRPFGHDNRDSTFWQ